MQLHGDSFHFPLTFGAADHASLDSSAMAIAKCTAWEKNRRNDSLYGKGRDKTVFGGFSVDRRVDMAIRIILLASLRRGAGEGYSV